MTTTKLFRAQDKTSDSDQTGVDVVEAAMQKVSWIIFNEETVEFTILRRIALLESDFGRDTAVMQANEMRGIWQVGINRCFFPFLL